MQTKILTAKVPARTDMPWPTGWGCGYVGIPPGHPWHGKDYDNIEAVVHGGLTYSDNHVPVISPPANSEDYWWVGFDTLHGGDTPRNCPESYVDSEIADLARQAEEAV